MIASAQHCSGGGLSYDDVDLFGRLRSLTIIRGLPLPDTVRDQNALDRHPQLSRCLPIAARAAVLSYLGMLARCLLGVRV
jgi:hypothetical protein